MKVIKKLIRLDQTIIIVNDISKKRLRSEQVNKIYEKIETHEKFISTTTGSNVI